MTPRRDLVVVGAAEGGLSALSTILNALPATFQAPVLVALRTHPESVQTLVRIMNGCSTMPVSYACDRLFGSDAAACGQRVIGVLLSGGDDEGALGLRAIEEAFGVVVVEDPDRAAVPALLQHPLDLSRPQHVARLDEFATLLATLVDG